MDVSALATLSRLIDEALDCDPAAQAAWLESLGPEHAPLKPTLARILGARSTLDSDNFLSTLPKIDTDDDDVAASEGAAAPGETIGRYKLIRELATGGMGAVWLAARTDGLVNRPVALKLPRGTWRRDGLAERMTREREILASLDHPNIARLYDAGIAPDGQPYLALEYVDGRPLDRYCREQALDLDARLRLFLQVVRAVAHAHSRLVVHRDLKPSNILVTADGDVRLLDFGIAKLLEPSASGDRLTELMGRALTPDYASPEQIAGGPIGTGSDIYSLGVVLFELLTGTRPYALKRESAAALEEAILEVEPRSPSDAAPDKATARKLRGDLDWIVARALAKHPEARYASADALASDIERHLRREPVDAAAPSAAYRIGKFVRRHRAGLAAALVVVLALIVGAVGTTLGLLRARDAEAAAREAADAARIEAATADRVTRFMVDLFDAAAPEQARGRDVTVREMLDRGAERVRDQLADQPLVQARLFQSLANAYSSLGLYAEARPLAESAVSAARSRSNAEGELAQALLTLGQLERRLDNAGDAENAIRESLAIQERRQGPTAASIGPTINELAMLLRTKSPDEAVGLYRRAYDAIVAEHGAPNGDAGILLANIGAIQTRQREYSEARDSLVEALDLVTKHYGEQDPRVAGVAGNLATVERELGNPLRAIELHRRDLELSSRALGESHPTIGTIWLNLARSTDRTGDYASALEQVDNALRIFSGQLGPAHALILTSENSRARYLVAAGRYDEAAARLREVIGRNPESPEGRVAQLAARVQLADLERQAGRFDEADRLAQSALSDPVIARQPRLRGDAHWARACALAAAGRRAEGDAAAAQAIEVQRTDELEPPHRRVYTRARYAACSGDPRTALNQLRDAIAKGFRDPYVLVDPVFASTRALPEFNELRDLLIP